MKAILVIGVILFALGIGSFSRQQMDEYKYRTSNNTTDTSNSDPAGTTLDLSGQQLTALPEAVLSRTDVTVLNISNNQLVALPAGIAGMTNLVELNIENNRLELLPAEIAQLKNLRRLRVDNNRMTSLPPELANMTWLEQLDISNNRLPPSEQDAIKSQLTNVQIKT